MIRTTIDQYCGESWRYDEANDSRQDNRPSKTTHVGKHDCEGCCTKDREPYHVFTPVAVAYPAAKERSDNLCR